MFRNSVTETPLTSAAADGYFHSINGMSFQGDVSFTATLRALVGTRVCDCKLTVRHSSSSYTLYDAQSRSPSSLVTDVYYSYIQSLADDHILIHNFASNDREANETCIKAVAEAFCGEFEGYHRLEKITEFFRKSFPVLCFVNPDTRTTVIFVESMDLRKWHYLQCATLAMLPWYFDPSDGMSDVEMALVKSLRETTPDKYIECLAEIAKNYDFRDAYLRKNLSGFESRIEETEAVSTRELIGRLRGQIAEYNNAIGDRLAQLTASNTKLLGLEAKMAKAGESSEILDYFLCNKKLTLYGLTGLDMIFCVSDYITYFDKDMAERTIKNKDSYVYRDYSGVRRTEIDPEKMFKLMSAIFIDEILRIKICASYRLRSGGGVSPLGAFAFSSEFNDSMPNPHIDRYECLGNHAREINSALEECDYIGAIEQCVASCKSLNWGDSTVMYTFINTLCGKEVYNDRCIELPDGSVVEPLEAIKWIEGQGLYLTEHEIEILEGIKIEQGY